MSYRRSARLRPNGGCPLRRYALAVQIVWSDHDGNRIEELLGVMLCRRFPHANRIRPAQGDGGIDVMVPVDDGLYDIYQVKGFTASLDNSQKQQVKNSLKRIASNPHVRVRDWHLVAPVNPTPAQMFDWFQPATKNYNFDCYWFGLDQCVGLAAEYPEVSRYYLGDGQHALEQALSNLRAIAPLALSGSSPGQLLTIGDLTGPFAAAHAEANRVDPHYRYDFMITKHFPFGLDSPPPPQPDGLDMAAAASAQISADVVITTLIFPRYAEAAADRPLTGTFVIPSNDDGQPIEGDAARFLEFGASGEFTVKSLAMDLPGGLSTSAVEALVKVGPPMNAQAARYDLRLVVIDADGKQLGKTVCAMEPVTAGVGANVGIMAHGTSQRGVFDLEMPMHPGHGTLSMRFHLRPLAGREPAAIAGEMWFLHSLASGVEVRVGPRYGPLVQPGLPLQGKIPAMFDDRLLHLIDDLALIQREVCATLRVPDLESELSPGDVKNLRIAAALLRGVTVRTTYTSQRFTLPPVEAKRIRDTMLGVPVGIEIAGSWRHEVAGALIAIEPIDIRLEASLISVDENVTDGFLAVPAQNDGMFIRKRPQLTDSLPAESAQ